jgi:hypothetical protein
MFSCSIGSPEELRDHHNLSLGFGLHGELVTLKLIPLWKFNFESIFLHMQKEEELIITIMKFALHTLSNERCPNDYTRFIPCTHPPFFKQNRHFLSFNMFKSSSNFFSSHSCLLFVEFFILDVAIKWLWQLWCSNSHSSKVIIFSSSLV